MNKLVSTTLAALILGAGLAVMGCGGGSSDAKGLMKDYVAVLESIQSVEDLEAKEGELKDLAKKMDAIQPSEAEGKAMMDDEEMKELSEKMQKEVMRIGTDPEMGKKFGEIMSSMMGE